MTRAWCRRCNVVIRRASPRLAADALWEHWLDRHAPGAAAAAVGSMQVDRTGDLFDVLACAVAVPR